MSTLTFVYRVKPGPLQLKVNAELQAEGKTLHVYSGATKVNCAGCGEACWAGPRQLRFLELGLAKPYCPECLGDKLQELGGLQGVVSLGNPESSLR